MFKKLSLALLWKIDWGEGVGGRKVGKVGKRVSRFTAVNQVSEDRDWDQSDRGEAMRNTQGWVY